METHKSQARIEETDDIIGEVSCLSVNPASKHRLVWDILGVFVLLYDMIMIPVVTVFQPADDAFMAFMGYFTLAYWSLDMTNSFVLGYYDRDGHLIMDLKKIATNYAKTWLAFDVVVVGIDWVIVLSEALAAGDSAAGESTMKQGKALRAMRILRTVRLLRLAKLRKIAQLVQDYVDSELLSVAFSLFSLVGSIIAINHFIACIWYGIGKSPPPNEMSWHVFFDTGSPILDDPSRWSDWDRYWVALHWSMTQFTPGSMPVQPQNGFERFFTVATLLFALVIFSSFVSSITATMTRLKGMAAKNATAFWLLRKYFRQHGVSRDLCVRVNRYISVVVESKKNKMQYKDVELLVYLSKPLRDELFTELIQPKVVVHPFLLRLSEKNAIVMQQICCTATKEMLISHGDLLFSPGVSGQEMYFLHRGKLGYEYADEQTQFSPLELCYAGDWFCESVLWMNWVHRGHMRAHLDSDIIHLDGKLFYQTLVRNPSCLEWTRAYAEMFIWQMCRIASDYRVTDLQSSMHRHERMADHLGSRNQSTSVSDMARTSVQTLSEVIEKRNSGRKVS
eukprot:gnl/TRDRNA2_/TRDRNA2_83425_c1_seq1.p1 gnl/TRDRNA2_/TRDRNA2_83425_c1~~gnl/TRDRNA2_/TRDRNA2_83425_c1_seq1.p1  ORF type:complete len:563 (+),score=78.66 gnl/TRDRNA2_/TRDRNA2_83425_c1_seq1:2-1690(+)